MIKLIVLLFYTGVTLGASKTSSSGKENTDSTCHPYIVSVSDKNFICAGTLISTRWVLTAAHCVFQSQDYTIRAGSTYRVEGGEMVPVEKVVLHPEFKNGTFDYDIALLKLKRDVKTSSAIPVALSSQQSPHSTGDVTVITGWGRLYKGGPLPNTLQVLRMSVVPEKDCKVKYKSAVTEREFCAVAGEDGKGLCEFDDGDPVVVKGFLSGLVSRGFACGLKDQPAIMTSIPAFRDWISQTSGI